MTLTDEAILRAYNAPGAEWKDEAWKLTLLFLGKLRRSGEPFTCENLRAYCEQRGLGTREPRAFGGIVRKLAQDKIIKKCGRDTTGNPFAHHREVTMWRVL